MTRYIDFDLTLLFENRFFSKLDYHFARYMARIYKEDDPIIVASCALVSKALSEGRICLDTGSLSGSVAALPETDNLAFKFPDGSAWADALSASELVSDAISTPLVLDSSGRLFMAKYYDFQIRLAQNISMRHSQPPFQVDKGHINRLIDAAFTPQDPHAQDQKNAVKNALCRHFTVISGGPGTGKTYVTKQIKQILQDLARSRGDQAPEILCVAPTGKAASKMDQGRTIHSVLKPLKGRPGFHHDKKNPLPVDVVIIDEGSMIDIILMTRLLEAIPMAARVILLGDRHQLASVQAGSVFADICSANEVGTAAFVLNFNYRSKGKTGIENLSRAINENDVIRVEQILTSGQFPDVVFEDLTGISDLSAVLKPYITNGFSELATASTPKLSLDKLEYYKLLCAHNSGRYGTLQINHLCENILRLMPNFDIQENHFQQVIMVKNNDYNKGLFNGDTGIISREKGELNAYIKTQDDDIKKYRVADLPAHETAFAITIHKSQGSEFDEVLILLPDRVSAVMTRQLLYTGVTRAKKRVIVAGGLQIIKKAVNLAVSHNSGLAECLDALCAKEAGKPLRKDS